MVIVKVIGAPSQFNPPLLNVGITIIVATSGTVPVLMAVNGRIFPVPLAANPIVVLLFVQEYEVAPAVFKVVKLTNAVLLLQNT
jgi:hypothetical protein